jgi:hypothetical protein
MRLAESYHLVVGPLAITAQYLRHLQRESVLDPRLYRDSSFFFLGDPNIRQQHLTGASEEIATLQSPQEFLVVVEGWQRRQPYIAGSYGHRVHGCLYA